jgi:hypothetical protein
MAACSMSAAESTPQVHLAGDSTMCNYSAESPIRGVIGVYFAHRNKRAILLQ